MQIITRCRAPGPLSEAALTKEEYSLVEALSTRLRKLADAAAARNVRLMVDAEHTYFQPAIDHAVLELQRVYNKEKPVVFNTYQAYLKDCRSKLEHDIGRSQMHGFKLGAKLVRGAYLYLERERAASLGISSPILPSLEATHRSYDQLVGLLLEECKEHGAELMVASHNQN